jgi:VanZ family protein
MDVTNSTRRLTRPQAVIALPAVALLLVAAFVPVPAALHGSMVRALLDFAHFSLAAVACWFLWARMGWAGWAAFAAVVAAAALCEVVQSFTGRYPSAADFVRGVLGALVVLICLPACRPSVPPAKWISALVVVVALSAWPVCEVVVAAARLCVRVGLAVS